MMGSFRRSMAWLHIWSGLIPGWILFCVCLTGTLSYFRQEISLWMQPELPLMMAQGDSTGTAAAALRHLADIAPGADRWMIDLPGPRKAVTEAYVWQSQPPGFQHLKLDPASGAPVVARDTFGGDFLYYFHFDLRAPWVIGRFIVGLAAMAMLIAIISGVITHRRIFADFFTFRAGKGGQRAWLDAHNVLGVLALPYHLMIIYTGLVTLMFLYLPWGIERFYGRDSDSFHVAAFGEVARPAPGHAAANLAPITDMLAMSRRYWRERADPGAPAPDIGRIEIFQPGRDTSLVEVTMRDDDHVSYRRDRLLFDGVTGAIIASDARMNAAAALHHAFYGLHIARFAPFWLRWLFFIAGSAATAMIGSGLVLWVLKRHRRLPTPVAVGSGLWLAQKLNIAVLIGLPLAIAGYFTANRWLPSWLEQRAALEAAGFFITWAIALLHAMLRPTRQGWIEQSAVAGLLFVLLPLWTWLATPVNLPSCLRIGDLARAGIDLACLAVGLLLLGLARLLQARLLRARPGDPAS